jgi:hypothetical protein
MMATTAWRDIASEHRFEEIAIPLSIEDRKCVLAELANLLECRHFKASRRCSDFLDHVVRQALNGNLASLKERTLGVELFNRVSAYDTNSDPIVRAVAGEVRKRIAQYYQESVPRLSHISLPVGTYVPRFEIQATTAQGANSEEPTPRVESRVVTDITLADPNKPSRIHPRITETSRAFPILSVLRFAVVTLLFYVGFSHVVDSRLTSQAPPTGSALSVFWKPFVAPLAQTVTVFSEVRRRAEPGPHGEINHPVSFSVGDMASPGISGVGEVMGVHALDGVFDSFHRTLRAKRSNFFTFDDASNENVIFLGSPRANPPLGMLQNNHDFVFQFMPGDSNQYRLAIVNNQPHPGEPKQFLSTPDSLPIQEDYALISLFQGMRPEERVLVLAGITTFGTQAAAEFVSRNDSLKALISRLKLSSNGELEPFEAVIRVKINDEVPVEEQIVAVHQK